MPSFQLPPRLTNAEGRTRVAGFELEFAGLDLDEAARLVAELFGGTHERNAAFDHVVKGTPFGDFKLESDASFLKKRKYAKALQTFGLDDTKMAGTIESGIARVTDGIVPNELVTPPIPMTQLDAVETLRAALHARQAVGTKASLLAGFGLHLNPEAPRLDAQTLAAYLKAFFLLYPWIFLESKIDLTRRVMPFINDFPEDYVYLVLDPGYQPDLDTLLDDYLRLTPSRNRPLDMLPLFATIDREQVEARVEEKGMVKPRPAFHYRLPNCSLGDPAWTIAEEWNRWVEVERLASDAEKLRAMCVARLASGKARLHRPDRAWAEEVPRWLT